MLIIKKIGAATLVKLELRKWQIKMLF